MCGIAGLFDLRGRRDFARALAVRINDIQVHRGPDEGAVHLEPGVALCHRRLSIIDVATGQQPLFNEDGSVCVVFNGEIYNYQDLVPELQALGHVFRTRSDTEVIVHAWEAWGEACVSRFRGMFAFAVFDRHRDTLFLARDRMGVKPLFYAELADGCLVFGSELKALTAHPEFRREIDPLAIEEYFALGYVAEPRSIYRGAVKLLPAHTLTLRRGQPMAQQRSYWDVRFSLDNPIGAQDAMAELRQRLEESVRLRLMSEVPLGAFLSGGVDSSAVVAIMAGMSGDAVRTCAIGFEDPSFNESRFAQSVASRYRTDHHLEVISGEDYGLIDRLAWLYDEPFADSSAIPTYRVCQLARRHVTVALSGDGGDESFGGYRRYRLHLKEQQLRDALPATLRAPVFGALGAVYPKLDWLPRMFRAKTTLQALGMDAVGAYAHSMAVLREDERLRMYSPAFLKDLGGYRAGEVFDRYAAAAGTDDPLALIQYVDYKTWLTGDINTKVDRASMAHSLEVREPLMDHKLVEWLATLPSSLKLRGQEGKWLFKKALEPMLPNDVLYRPKMGFSVPLARWLRGPLKARLEAACRGERVADTGRFDMGRLSGMVDEHLAGSRDFSAPLWSVLMFDAFLANAGKMESPAESATGQAS
jgi:asparagine synthase (glutamine-hydrolysing)